MPATTAPSAVLDGDLDPTRYAYLTPAAAAAPPTLAQLARSARALASRPERWSHLLRFDPVHRFRRRLDPADLRDLADLVNLPHGPTGTGAGGAAVDPGYEAWLMTWLPGQRTGVHDHGDSVAVIAVVEGELHEHAVAADGPRLHRIRPDQVRIWGARHAREIVNSGDAPAVSVHLYAPPRVTTD